MILIYLNCIISNVQRRNCDKKDANFLAWEGDSMTSVDCNFNFLYGRPHGAGLPLPPSICVHLSPTPFPLRVDVINGWPLILSIRYCDDSEHSCEAPQKWPAKNGAIQIVIFTLHYMTYNWCRNYVSTVMKMQQICPQSTFRSKCKNIF